MILKSVFHVTFFTFVFFASKVNKLDICLFLNPNITKSCLRRVIFVVNLPLNYIALDYFLVSVSNMQSFNIKLSSKQSSSTYYFSKMINSFEFKVQIQLNLEHSSPLIIITYHEPIVFTDDTSGSADRSIEANPPYPPYT